MFLYHCCPCCCFEPQCVLAVLLQYFFISFISREGMNSSQLCSSGNRKAHPFTKPGFTEGFNLPWCHWKGDMKRAAPWHAQPRGLQSTLWVLKQEFTDRIAARIAIVAPLHYYSAPCGAALLQSDVKIHPVEIYIHIVSMWVTPEGKV